MKLENNCFVILTSGGSGSCSGSSKTELTGTGSGEEAAASSISSADKQVYASVLSLAAVLGDISPVSLTVGTGGPLERAEKRSLQLLE